MKTYNAAYVTKTVLCGFLALGMTAGAGAAEQPVDLGVAASFGVLAGTTVTNAPGPQTIINGDLGVYPGTAITGFPPGIVTGNTYAGGPVAANAQAALAVAYDDASGRSTAPVTVAGNLGGQTLPPGLYKSTSSLAVSSGDLTLDGQGDPNAVFIFQIASTFTMTSGRKVILVRGAQPKNIFWQIGTSATFGTTSIIKGTILAGISITMETGATLDGKALAKNGGVTIGGGTAVTANPTNAASDWQLFQ